MSYRTRILITAFLFFNQLEANSQSPLAPERLQTKAANCGFIENKGQIKDQDRKSNSSVRFLLPLGGGMNIQVKANSMSYDTYTTEAGEVRHNNKLKNDPSSLPPALTYKFHRVDISFPGASLNPQLIAEKKSTDYRIYSNAENGNSIVVYHYERIRYIDLYPNIDLVLEKNNKGFEYYFVVKPGGDPGKIRIRYNGAATRLRGKAISIHVRQGEIIERIPSSFLVDEVALEFQRTTITQQIKVSYAKIDQNTYAFTCSSYDQTKTLVIDPVPDLVWGTYWGSNNNDWSYCIATDAAGDIVIAGGTGSNNNIATIGAYQTTFGGNEDALIGKFKADGTLLYVTYVGGNDTEAFFSVTTDNSNNIYVAGITASPNTISTAGTHQPTIFAAGFYDAMIMKFTPNGFRTWGTYYGGEDVEYLHSIKLDQAGNIFVAGWTHSTTGISTPGSFQPDYGGGILNDAGDAILAKFTPSGNRVWATYFGGVSFDRFYDMDIDNAGFLYCTGITYSPASIATPGSFQPVFAAGVSDAFLAKFDVSGNRLWATYYGGNNQEYAASVVIGSNGYINISGVTQSSSGFGTAGTQQPTFGGGQRDAFIAQFDANGLRRWGTYLGGTGDEQAEAITSDANGNIYVTGPSYSTNNISTPNSYQSNLIGTTSSTYLVKYNSIGVKQWGTYYGHSGPYGAGEGRDLVVDNNGNVYVTGVTSFSNNIATCNAAQQSWSSNLDMFLARFSETQSSAPSVTIAAAPAGPYCASTLITFTASPVNTGSPVTYQWKVNGINVGTNSITFAASGFTNGDVVSCVVTTAPTACNPVGVNVTSNTITLTLTAAVTPSISINASSITICTGGTVTFTSGITNGGINPVYQWKINAINVGTNSPTFSSSTLNNGDVVSCTLTSSLTCVSSSTVVSNTISINVNSVIPPIISINIVNNNVCAGTPVTINAANQNVSGPVIYQWKLNGVSVGSNSPTYSSNTFANGDNVSCLLVASFPICPDMTVSSNTVTLIIKDIPSITLLPGDVTIFWGETVQLTVSSTGPISNFTWSPITNLNNPASLSPQVSPDQTTTYSITVSDINGCSVMKGITISVVHDIKMPSAFTPNNDGKNDLFQMPQGIAITLDEFSIFDRAGQRVFYTLNPAKGWDGNFNGSPLPIGIYVYLIKGKTSKGNLFLKGPVTLIR